MLWQIEKAPQSKSWLYDDGEKRFVSYEELLDHICILERTIMSDQKLLVTLFCDNSPVCIAAYLAILRSGHAVMLVNASTDISLKNRILQIYSPEIVIHRGELPEISAGRYKLVSQPLEKLSVAFSQHLSCSAIHADTGVLLSTSGTTGSPKLVRLSYQNIQSNAEAIAEYLDITAAETGITSLPMSYSYGLSVVNSHLLAGANLVCTNASVVTKDFWTLFKKWQCTSFAGVPFSYLMLEKLRFGCMELPALRTITQAGGRLSSEKVQLFCEISRSRNYRFFVMYGQTEATARISYVPFERLSEKIGSVGVAIPRGTIQIENDGKAVGEMNREGEIVYEGPNVMQGYAESRSCLAKGDEQMGRLKTGDIGYKDADGYLYITGRLNRFIKVFGLRLNLDEVERMLESVLSHPVACVGNDENLHVLIDTTIATELAEAKRCVISLYQLHHSTVYVHGTSNLPLTVAGKKDYKTIERELSLV